MKRFSKPLRLTSVMVGAALLLMLAFLALQSPAPALADPIDPPEGYPKLSLSVKTVTPTLSSVGSQTLTYRIEIRNTGAYTAANAALSDPIPANTTYNTGSAVASDGSVGVTGNVLNWNGDVGFDATVAISFSVAVSPTFSGDIVNSAVISHPLISEPITVSDETVVTDYPILVIEKTSSPAKPGPNKSLIYTLKVTNQGQPATNLPITVTDRIPADTALLDVGPDGAAGTEVVTWTRNVGLALGESTTFTFSVTIDDVDSGTVITNADYRVSSSLGESVGDVGDVYTVTVVDPEFTLFKEIVPDPPGSNREATYVLTLLNSGSLATDIVVTDTVPTGVEYVSGGAMSAGVVSWTQPSLDTGKLAQFTYTVYISDVAYVDIVNSDYAACSAEGVCQAGKVLTSAIDGPNFATTAMLDPIAKKPGGGGGPVTPTLTVENLGPGNALSATAIIEFGRISVSAKDMLVIPDVGNLSAALDCGDKCTYFVWVGDLAYGDVVTFTTTEGQSTIGGEEETTYTATVIITDSIYSLVSDTLQPVTTDPVSSTAIGRITHYANLIPTKSAPEVIGRGQLMTYTLTVWNSALSTEQPPPYPLLWDVIPTGTTVITISDGGAVEQVLTGTLQMTVISWTLPALGTGERIQRTFTVQVDNDLVSGTKIINQDYRTVWYESEITETLVNFGEPVTTTVQEVGLIDSYKEVTPTIAFPGPDNVLTYYLHIVNSSGVDLSNVTVYDTLPWQDATYQRDAVASAPQVSSDIVSVKWQGDVAGYSEEVVTFTVKVDPYFMGVITNTAIISHPDLLSDVEVDAVAYITEEPVLRITKSAEPDPVRQGDDLWYTIHVVNLGQRATGLVISDVIPANTTYVSGGTDKGDWVEWQLGFLEPGQSEIFKFVVTVDNGAQVVNDQYAVTSAEGVSAVGEPVVTDIAGGGNKIYLPIIMKQ